MRTIVVGDVHGCLEELDELLRLLGYEVGRGADRLVFLGDFMDRGPDPVGVVRRVRELGVEAVMGNHEESHIRWRRHEGVQRATGKKNPMRPFSEQRQRQNAALSDDDIAWMTALPATIDLTGGHIAVHAGFEPLTPVRAHKPSACMRTRYIDAERLEQAPLGDDFAAPTGSVFWSFVWPGPEHVIYGHAIVDSPLISEFSGAKTFGIDTGCCFGGALTAMVTEDDFASHTFVQVKAKAVHCTPPIPVHVATPILDEVALRVRDEVSQRLAER